MRFAAKYQWALQAARKHVQSTHSSSPMHKFVRLLASFALATFISSAVAAPRGAERTTVGELTFVVTEVGQYETVGDVVDVPQPNTAAGKMSEHEKIRLVRAGNQIPAKKGNAFGFRYRVEGKRDGPMTGAEMHVVHPPMQGVDGRIHTTTTASIDLYFESGVAEEDIIYMLSEDFEVLPGTWILQIRFDGKVAATRTFELR
jgi:hypothetical protein